MMRRIGLLPVTAALAVAAAGLRAWQRASAFEPETGLLIPHAPATYAVVGAVVLAAVALAVAALRLTKAGAPGSYLAAFALPGRWMLAVYVAAGGCLVAGGICLIAAGTPAAQMGPSDSRVGMFQLFVGMGQLLCGAAMLPGAVSMGLVGLLNGSPAEDKGRFSGWLVCTAATACLWAIYSYQGHTLKPNMMEFVFYFLGVACTLVALLDLAAFSFEGPRPRRFVWTSAMGVICLATAVVDFWLDGQTAALLLALGYAVYLSAQLGCFLWRLDVPAALEQWTPPAEDEEERQEVTEDE